MTKFRFRARLLPVAAAVLLLATAAGCGNSLSSGGGSGTASGPLKVGFIVPLTGVYAGIGKSMQNGMQLYLDQQGGKLGGKSVQLVTADEGADPQSGVAAARKLLERDNVNVATGIVSSAVAQAVKTNFISAKTVLIASNGQPYDPTETHPSQYIWTDSFPTPPLTESMGQYLAKKYGSNGVYFVAADYAAGHQLVDGTKSALEKAGGKSLGESYAPLGTTQDYQPYLAQIRQSGAKAVYSFFAGSDAVRFVQQYAQFGLSKQATLYADGALTDGAALTAEGPAAAGIVTNWHYSDTLDNPKNKAFVDAYQSKFGSRPDVFALDQYDAAHVLDLAVQKMTTGFSSDALVKALQNLGTIDSPRGRWYLDQYQRPAQTVYLRRVDNSNGTLANTIIDDLGFYNGIGEKVQKP